LGVIVIKKLYHIVELRIEMELRENFLKIPHSKEFSEGLISADVMGSI